MFRSRFSVPAFLWSAALVLLAANTMPLQAVAENADPVLAPAVECTPRGGVPNVTAKLKTGKEVKVGYLGGSITAAPGWRVKSLKWLQEQYPQAKLSEIHAAIGGTGSDLGVFRLQRDVLVHKPDLLFVEFAVNDAGATVEQVQRCMEGIVRQTWQANPSTDICFVYTFSEPLLKDLKDGKFPRSTTAMEGVAQHYSIPSIHMGLEAVKLEKEGKLLIKSDKPAGDSTGPMIFSNDGVHPFVETGHELYAQAIARSFPKLTTVGKAVPHELIKPLREDNWEKAKLLPITESMLTGKWSKLDFATDPVAKNYSQRMDVLWKAEEPGASLQFTINGSVAAIYDLVGPDGGRLNIEVDGEAKTPQNRIDSYCTYHRLSKTNVLHVATDGKHTIKLTLSPDKLDKSSILFEKNRPDLEKNPAKYAPHVWYAGGVMILGDLVE